MFLFSWFGRSNLGRMTHQTLDSQFFHEVQKPLHRSGGFDAHTNRSRKAAIELSRFRVLFTTSPVLVSSIANVCWRASKSHPIIFTSASFGPSSVRVNTEQFTRAVTRPASLRHQSGVVIGRGGMHRPFQSEGRTAPPRTETPRTYLSLLPLDEEASRCYRFLRCALVALRSVVHAPCLMAAAVQSHN
jgi:hypothetical protein